MPAEFLLSPEEVEKRYRLREAELRALKEIAAVDPDVYLLSARALYNLLKGELEFSVSPEDLDKVCRTVVALPGGSLPPYIQLDRARCLTLAEAFDLLARALDKFGTDGKRKWPEPQDAGPHVDSGLLEERGDLRRLSVGGFPSRCSFDGASAGLSRAVVFLGP